MIAPSQNRGSGRQYLALAVWTLLEMLRATSMQAHEGHAPLPTRGAQVDVARGELILSREARDTLDVRTAEAELRPVEGRILAYATLVAPWKQHAFATTRLPGRISKLHVFPGQFVKAGQPLAEVDSLELESLRVEMLNAQNDVRLSAKIVRELSPAVKKGAVPEQRAIEAEMKWREDAIALEIAKSKWRSLQLPDEQLQALLANRDSTLDLSSSVISPIGGVIIHADVAVGKVVDPTEHLYEIIDLESVWVKIGLMERDLSQVNVGHKVRLAFAAYPGERFNSQVGLRGLFLDPQTHLATVWGELRNPQGQAAQFLPGMHGEAQIGLPNSGKLLTIPIASVMNDGVERYVLVEETETRQGSQYKKKNIATGRQIGDHIEVVAGDIVPGDRVVTQGSHELAVFFVQGVLRPSAIAAKNIGLRIEPMRKQAIDKILEIDGSVEIPPDRRTVVSSPLPGTVQRILVDRNQVVKRGDVVGEVASLELHTLQLDLLRAHLEAKLFDESLERIQTASASLPQRRLWEIETQRNAAVNRRTTLSQKLLLLGLSASQIQLILDHQQLIEALPLRAPLDGAVIGFDRVLGQVIRAEEPLFEIHDLSRAWVQGYLSERDLAKVQLGQSARVRLVSSPQVAAHGKVARSGQVVGTENRTLSIWVEFDQPPESILHNMLARLTLSTEKSSPLPAVPLSAVVREGTRSYVFVRKGDGTFERRHVETGRADDRHVSIQKGIELGEEIAVQGAAELQTAYAGLR